MLTSLNLSNILYLAFRLGPFILVCYFVLSSLFSQDFKSLIYLAGLILTCFVTILCGNLPIFSSSDSSTAICNQVTLTGGEPLSLLPLSTTVYIFTFFYLIMAMFYNPSTTSMNTNAIAANYIPILVLFPLVILMDLIWLLFYNCSTITRIISSMIIGGGFGALWAYIIMSSSMSNLLFLTVMSNSAICQRPTKTTMKCTKKTNTPTNG